MIQEFFTSVAAICPVSESGNTQPPDGYMLAAPEQRLDIEWCLHESMEVDYLGLKIDRLMGLGNGDEIVLFTGSDNLDGVYYVNHEIFFSVEEFEVPDELFDDYLEFVDRDEFLEMSGDEKLELFEEELEFHRVAADLGDFLGMLRLVSHDEFYGD